MANKNNDLPVSLRDVELAAERLAGVVRRTPLLLSKRLSNLYQAKVYLKREDVQVVRSYKLRGAYNFISSLGLDDRKKGVVCASAGNHAQGVAYSCNALKIKGYIFMPKNTPKQKIDMVRFFGDGYVEIKIVGDSFDEAAGVAKTFCDKNKKIFVHPFDDRLVIAGQGTVAQEIYEQLDGKPDYLVVPVGGGGLLSGMSVYAKERDRGVKVIGAEPAGAPSMYQSLKAGRVVTLDHVDKFVDGAAVKKSGEQTLKIIKKLADQVLLVPEGAVAEEMISLYQREGVIAEPAGALSVAALEQLKTKIKGKTVVCVISGGNNDISRYAEIIERSLVYQGLKHYFIIEFSQRPGALRQYLDEVLGPNDDITLFEYVKKNNKENGPALVGLELANKDDLKPLLSRMDKIEMVYQKVDNSSPMARFLI